MIPDAGHRIGLYWMGDALMLAWLARMAAGRLRTGLNRPRASILAFAVSWLVLTADFAAIRFGLTHYDPMNGWTSEIVRAASVVSLGWMAWEYRSGSKPWNGSERRSFLDRRHGWGQKGVEP